MVVIVDSQVGNLPAEVSSFVGRRPERAELSRLLAASRLVTVTGVGGVGKTRLALRVATEARRLFPDGVWWVELSALSDPTLLAHAVAGVVGAQDQSARPQVQALADFLAGRRLLVVLDTCEHLVDACAALVERLLAAAPGLRVLATSRQPLGVVGEHVFAVPPLPVPGQHDDGAGPARYPAVQLFVERAQAARGGFALTAENQAAVSRLCQRLDGIPLALELAAVRLRALSPEQVLVLLDDRFRLLTGRRSAGPARHETLRAAIAWSHELCSPAERLLWARVSVFAGDFDLTAAREVAADELLPADDVVDLVAGLVDKSILLREEHPGGLRYRLLDTIREYGADLLRAAGEADLLRRRHRDHYLGLARRFAAEWCGPDQVDWCWRLRREHPNLRAALDAALADPDGHRLGLEMAAALYSFWIACGYIREGRHYLDRALALDQGPGPVRTAALWRCGYVSVMQGDLPAAEAWLAECRTVADPGDAAAAGWIAYTAGMVALFRGELAEAARLGAQSAALHRGGGDAGIGLQVALGLQSMACTLTGEPDRAAELAEQCHAECHRHGERWIRSYASYLRAEAELARGEPAAATRYAQEALRFKRQVGDSAGTAVALDLLAAAAAAQGEADRAARLLGAAHQVWHTFGLPQFGSPDMVARRDQAEREARAALGDRGYQAAFAAGQALDLDAALAHALDEPDRSPPAGWAALTPRERQTAELVAEGLTNAQIAARLLITSRTAATHIEHILAKLGASNRTQVAAWVAEHRTRADHGRAALPAALPQTPGSEGRPGPSRQVSAL